VVETEPVVKGQTAANSYKPAILDNGVRVMVPPFVGEGEASSSTPRPSSIPNAPEPDPAPPAAPAVTVTENGTIERPRDDGTVLLFNPATGFRGMRFPDGTTTQQLFFEVQPVTPPDLPPDYAGWSESVSGSVDNLVGNLLRPEETATLQSAAPDDFFERLDYNLKVLAFITGQ
jgi:hypothetical protein